MELQFSAEQDQLRSSARGFLEDRYPLSGLAERMRADPSPGDQVRLASLGWLDEDLTVSDLAVLWEESARVLVDGPFFATTALALPVLPPDVRGDVAAGRRSVTLAWAEPAGSSRIELAGGEVTGGMQPDRGRLTGRKVLVPDLRKVTDVIVVAADGLYLVDLSAAGVDVTQRTTTDRSRPLDDLDLRSVPGIRVAGRDALDGLAVRAGVGVALEGLGVAERCLSLAVDHARSREQFGMPIGRNQAVAHRLADVWVAVELARSLSYWAVAALEASPEMPSLRLSSVDLQARRASLAASIASAEAAVRAAECAIQCLGGLGFTWEHSLHWYYRRARWLLAFGEGALGGRRQLADAVLGASARDR
jgi:alkylation response protein AidB-like acyl-CoA dehydrogenase